MAFFFYIYCNFFFNTVAVESDTINKANSEPSDMQSSVLVCRRDTFHYDVCQLPAKIHNIMHITQQNPQFGRRGAELMTSLQCRNVAKSSWSVTICKIETRTKTVSPFHYISDIYYT